MTYSIIMIKVFISIWKKTILVYIGQRWYHKDIGSYHIISVIEIDKELHESIYFFLSWFAFIWLQVRNIWYVSNSSQRPLIFVKFDKTPMVFCKSMLKTSKANILLVHFFMVSDIWNPSTFAAYFVH